MAISKNFTSVNDTDIDADSPITVGLMTDFRDNDIHLEEWLGKDYTAAENHDHDGTNSKATKGSLSAGDENYAAGATTTASTLTVHSIASVVVPSGGKMFVQCRIDLKAFDTGFIGSVDSIDIKHNGATLRSYTIDNISGAVEVDGMSFSAYSETGATGTLEFILNGSGADGYGYEQSHLTYQVFN